MRRTVVDWLIHQLNNQHCLHHSLVTRSQLAVLRVSPVITVDLCVVEVVDAVDLLVLQIHQLNNQHCLHNSLLTRSRLAVLQVSPLITVDLYVVKVGVEARAVAEHRLRRLITNCLGTPHPCNDSSMLRRVRNCYSYMHDVNNNKPFVTLFIINSSHHVNGSG